MNSTRARHGRAHSHTTAKHFTAVLLLSTRHRANAHASAEVRSFCPRYEAIIAKLQHLSIVSSVGHMHAGLLRACLASLFSSVSSFVLPTKPSVPAAAPNSRSHTPVHLRAVRSAATVAPLWHSHVGQTSCRLIAGRKQPNGFKSRNSRFHEQFGRTGSSVKVVPFSRVLSCHEGGRTIR